MLPAPVLALDILAPSLLFAGAAVGARRVARVFGPIAAMFTFAALWAGLDLLLSLDPAVGSMLSPASTEVVRADPSPECSARWMFRTHISPRAVAAGIALSLRTRDPTPAVIATVLFAVNVAYGYWRVSHPPTATTRVALIDSNTYGYWAPSIHEHPSAASIEAAALRVIDAYTAKIAGPRGRHLQLVVLPENITEIGRLWRGLAWSRLAAADLRSASTWTRPA